MVNSEFKKLFEDAVLEIGFRKAFGAWYRESTECLIVLDLQKSNYGNYFDLNINVFIHGVFGDTHLMSKSIIKRNESSSIFRQQPSEYSYLFDLDKEMTFEERKTGLNQFVSSFLNIFTKKALTRKGIFELAADDQILLLSAVEEEINKLN